MFSSRVLIFGSATETEIFSPSSITRIEIVTTRDLTEFLPKQSDDGEDDHYLPAARYFGQDPADSHR